MGISVAGVKFGGRITGGCLGAIVGFVFSISGSEVMQQFVSVRRV